MDCGAGSSDIMGNGGLEFQGRENRDGKGIGQCLETGNGDLTFQNFLEGG